MVFDLSGSIAPSEWTKYTNFMDSLLRKLPLSKAGMQAGILGYATDVNYQSELSSDISKLLAARKELVSTPNGRTFTDKAVSAAIAQLTKSGFTAPGPKAMVVLTDGLPTDRAAAEKAYLAAAVNGIKVLTVLVGEANLWPPPASWSTVAPIQVTSGMDGLTDSMLDRIIRQICEMTESSSSSSSYSSSSKPVNPEPAVSAPCSHPGSSSSSSSSSPTMPTSTPSEVVRGMPAQIITGASKSVDVPPMGSVKPCIVPSNVLPGGQVVRGMPAQIITGASKSVDPTYKAGTSSSPAILPGGQVVRGMPAQIITGASKSVDPTYKAGTSSSSGSSGSVSGELSGASASSAAAAKAKFEDFKKWYELQTNTAAPVLYTAPPVSPPTTLPVSPTSPVSHPATPPLSHPMVVVPSPKPVSTAKPIVPAPTAPAQSPISVINKMILHPPTSVKDCNPYDMWTEGSGLKWC